MATIVTERKGMFSKKPIENEDNVYYNIKIVQPTDASGVIEADYNVSRTVPILDNPSEYEMAVVRFYIPAEFPIFVWDENKTLNVMLSFDGVDSPVSLAYVDYCSGICNPPNSVFWYQQFVDMVNTALATSFSTLKTIKPLAPPTQAPFITFDSSSELFTFNAQTLYNEVDAGGPTIKIYMSSELRERYFNSFIQDEVVSYGGNLYGNITVKNLYTNNVTYNSSAYYAMVQEYSTLALWNGVQAISFETDRIPVEPEYTSALQTNTDTGLLESVNQKNITKRILTDFEPLVDVSNRQAIQFFPKGPLRWYDLKSNTPLRDIDMRLLWNDADGTSYPIYIAPGQSLTVKLRFRRKASRYYREDEEET